MDRRNFFKVFAVFATMPLVLRYAFAKPAPIEDPLGVLREMADRANARITAEQERAYEHARKAWVDHLSQGLRTPDRAWFKLVKAA